MSEYSLGVVYDHRFAAFDIAVDNDSERKVFIVPAKELLADVSREELLAMLDPKYAWTEGVADIDQARIRMLEETDFKNKVVLDVGGYDGFAAEIALKGGAGSAICLDNHQYEHYGWEDKKKAGVDYIQGDFMRSRLKGQDKLEFRHANWKPQQLFDRPDTIIFYNVLYHLKNPWAALDHLREIIKPDGEMLLCTLFRYHTGPWMYVYNPKECNESDDTVYFGPSLEALERLLHHTGWDFEQYALAYDRVLYRCKPTAGFQKTHEDS